MAAQDTVTKQYVSEAEVFADAFNCLMYADQPEQVLAFVPDYRVQLIDPMRMEDADFARLNSRLREVPARQAVRREGRRDAWS